MAKAPDLSLKLLNITETATILGVSIYSIKAALARGAFPQPIIISKSRRWSLSTIRAFAEGRWRAPEPSPAAAEQRSH